MAQLSVNINGRAYDVACEDGQEERLSQLAQYVDGRLSEIAEAVGQIGDQRLLVMTSLLIADELGDAQYRIADLEKARSEVKPHLVAEEGSISAAEGDAMADSIESLAERVETIAQKLTAD
jgi:cell division protein ZapA